MLRNLKGKWQFQQLYRWSNGSTNTLDKSWRDKNHPVINDITLEFLPQDQIVSGSWAGNVTHWELEISQWWEEMPADSIWCQNPTFCKREMMVRNRKRLERLLRACQGSALHLHYCSDLENSMDYTVHRVPKSQTRLSAFNFHLTLSGFEANPRISPMAFNG